MKRYLSVLLVSVTSAIAFTFCPTASADPILQSFSGGSSFSSYNGQPFTAGWSFSVNTPSVVTDLGFWDNPNVAGPIAESHEVGIWSNAGVLLGSVDVTPTSTLIGDFRYEALTTPVLVTAGVEYVLGAFYPSGNSDYYTTGTTSQTLISGATLLSSRRDASTSGSTFDFPSISSGPGGRFGPNALISPASVPEPSSLISAALGLATLAGYAGWRRIRGAVA